MCTTQYEFQHNIADDVTVTLFMYFTYTVRFSITIKLIPNSEDIAFLSKINCAHHFCTLAFPSKSGGMIVNLFIVSINSRTSG